MRSLGNIGEDAAVNYLKKRGYKIVERNYRSRFGEIDIVAKHKEYYVFVEVKMRRDDFYGGGEAAVDKFKQRKLRLTAELYLQEKRLDTPVRFDVVLIHSDGDKIKSTEIEVIQDAFGY